MEMLILTTVVMLSLSGNHLKVFQSMIFSDVVEAIKVSVEESKKLTCYAAVSTGRTSGKIYMITSKQRKQK